MMMFGRGIWKEVPGHGMQDDASGEKQVEHWSFVGDSARGFGLALRWLWGEAFWVAVVGLCGLALGWLGVGLGPARLT